MRIYKDWTLVHLANGWHYASRMIDGYRVFVTADTPQGVIALCNKEDAK